MFYATLYCVIGVACGLTGSYTSPLGHRDKEACFQSITAALILIGEEPTRFRIDCRVRNARHPR